MPHQQGNWQPLLVSYSQSTCSFALVSGGVGIRTGSAIEVGSGEGVTVGATGVSICKMEGESIVVAEGEGIANICLVSTAVGIC